MMRMLLKKLSALSSSSSTIFSTYVRRTTLLWLVVFPLTQLCISAPPSAANQVIESVGSMGGWIEAVVTQGNFAYTGEGANLTVLDISDPSHPLPVGKVMLRNQPEHLAVSDSLVLCAFERGGLQIVDVSDPAKPIVVGDYKTEKAYRVALNGSLALVANSGRGVQAPGLEFLDISNPAQPSRVGFYPIPEVNGFAALDSLVCVASESKLEILDVSDPANPVNKATHPLEAVGLEVRLNGKMAYVGTGHGLEIVDISNPAAPVAKGSYMLMDQESLNDPQMRDARVIWSLGSSGTTVAVSQGTLFRLLDVSDPSAPIVIASLTHGTMTENDMRSPRDDSSGQVSMTESLALVTGFWGGIKIIDYSKPKTPTLKGEYLRVNFPTHITVVGSNAFVTDYKQGLLTYDVSNPTAPTSLGRWSSPNPAVSVAVLESTACVVLDDGTLQVLDVSDPAAPRPLGSCALSHKTSARVTVSGTFAYCVRHHLDVVDISNPKEPKLIGTCKLPTTGYDVDVAEKLAYVADGELGLQIVDISNPAAPALRGVLLARGKSYGVDVQGSLVALAHDRDLLLIDVSDPDKPTLLATLKSKAQDVQLAGSIAWVSSDRSVTVVDVSGPSAPSLIGSYSIGDDVGRIAISDKYAYATFQTGGVHILRCKAEVASSSAPLLPSSTVTPPAPIRPQPSADPSAKNVVPVSENNGPVAVKDGRAYYLHGDLFILDVADPAMPREIGRIELEGRISGKRNILVRGSQAIISGEPGLQIVDTANLKNLGVMSYYKSRGGARSGAMAIEGNTAYVVTSLGVEILDISNPANIVQIGVFDTAADAAGLAISDSILYIANDFFGLLLLDVSNPASPVPLGNFKTAQKAYSVSVSSSIAYVFSRDWPAAGLEILDVSDPASLELRGSLNEEFGGRIALQGANVFMPKRGGRLQILDASDPTRLVPTTSIETKPYRARGIAFADGLVYLAGYRDRQDALQIVDLSDQAKPMLLGTHLFPEMKIDYNE